MHLNSTTSNKVPKKLQYWSHVASNFISSMFQVQACFWFFLPSPEIPVGQRGKFTKIFLTWSSTAMLLHSATYWESIEYVRPMYQTSLNWACPKGLAFVAYKGGDNIFKKLIPHDSLWPPQTFLNLWLCCVSTEVRRGCQVPWDWSFSPRS